MDDFGPIGITSDLPLAVSDAGAVAEEARAVERLGFSMLWRAGNLPMVRAAVHATERLRIATGIIPVTTVPAADVTAIYHELRAEHPGRFVVGLGGAHTRFPLRTMQAYLDDLDAAQLPAEERILAALGPNMLALARDRAAGGYPYLVPPSYVRQARSVLGAERRLVVLLMVIPSTDRAAVRTAAAGPLDFLTKVAGYRRNLRRLGFTVEEIDGLGDRLLDEVTAWGAHDAIAARVAQYRAAGADQVVLNLVGTADVAASRARLAEALADG